MTSIDKAMAKLAGEEPEVEAEPATKSLPDAAKVGLATDSPDASEPDVAAVESAASPGVAVEAPVSSVASEDTKVPDSPAPAPLAPTAGGEGPYVQIDFNKLRLAGNLTPDADFTRVAEEYQYIKRRLLGNVALNAGHNGRPANLIMVTSSVPGEGKTFTSTNLAMSMSIERDHTILLVDTDIMKRDLSRQFGLSDSLGLYDYLDRQVDDIAEVIHRTNIPNMAIIPAGRYTKVSTELLASARMRDLVEEFATRYHDRIVLFDTPPLMATTTAVALAPLVGQLALVVEAGETRSAIVEDAIRTLDRVPITGLILNKSKGSTLQTYDYYGYYQPKSEPGR